MDNNLQSARDKLDKVNQEIIEKLESIAENTKPIESDSLDSIAEDTTVLPSVSESIDKWAEEQDNVNNQMRKWVYVEAAKLGAIIVFGAAIIYSKLYG